MRLSFFLFLGQKDKMQPEILISWRYLFAKRKEKFLSLITLISISGVAIGVSALLVVLGVMSGFDEELKEKITGNYADITVTRYEGIEEDEYLRLKKQLEGTKHIQAVSPYLLGQALVRHQDRFFAVTLKGIVPQEEIRVSKLQNYLFDTSVYALQEKGVFIGKELAFYLGIHKGSYLTLYSPTGKEYKLTVAGIFNSGMFEYDMNLIFVHFSVARELLGLNNRFSAISVKLDNLYRADKVADDLLIRLGWEYTIRTWDQLNRNFFAALKLEKLVMFIILTLIVVVACFNIASTLIVMVVEKTKDIGILKAIGMTQGRIRRVFLCVGVWIGTLGILSGTALGLALIFLLKKYQFIKLPQDIYYIDRLPVYLKVWPDLILVILSAAVITLLATVYPAWRAGRMTPAQALRYE